MIIPSVKLGTAVLRARVTYTGWFLSMITLEPELSRILRVPPNGEPRLMLIRLGDRGALKVSPLDGRLVGIEFFGIRLNGIEVLPEPIPDPENHGAVIIPLDLPYDPIIYETGSGEAPCREAGFRQIGYRAAATRGGHMFRIQLFRGGPVESYMRIADCAVVGLSQQGALVEIWLDQVQVPNSPDLPV